MRFANDAALEALIARRRFAQPDLENNLDFECRHLAILDRFGRYPTATPS
jgi:uncharacterized protein (DUF924 family)